jgi:uncharacterized membrane protein YkvI
MESTGLSPWMSPWMDGGNMKKNKVSTFKVAATYIGTVIGAGFASGQEILQFFSVFGKLGLLGLVIVTALFILFGYIIMDLGRQLGSTSHLKIIKYSGGKIFGAIADFIITFFLFGALTAMIAGAGAMFKQQFSLPAIWGNLLMAVVTSVTVLTGINGVINSISFVVPFLIIAVLGVSISSIFAVPHGVGYIEASAGSGLVKNWLWAAILYTSYNIILSIAVLGPLGAEAENRKSIRNGAILGGLGLGIGASAIYFALARNIANIMNFEVPMAFIAGQISYIIQALYIVVLLAEVYTTAVGSLYGFAARIANVKSFYGKLLIIGTTALSFIASQFGFSNLVKYLYPAIGYGGVIILINLLYCYYKKIL